MPDGDDAQSNDEPTDEMVKAGVVALLACEIGAATDGEIVRKIYNAMRRAARGTPSAELDPDE